ncbi:TRAP transporter small permease [Vreelandella arcis]|uniref:TRAP transporter small permease protein n=1 Tax=Vreelandella arcis TaxID=416873 RepID=A0A1H0H0T9_9GAMM|nr:TRAP transporter small permease [Halomonas arcis]SDO12664.1 TRAP-type C4-dicarboxylate transport system, small permease component [Halomonas arcis]
MSIELESSVDKENVEQSGPLDRLLDSVASVCILVAGILLVALIAIFGWLVFGRYVLNNTPTWVEQAALLMVVYITCLGAAAGVRHHSHLNIDFIRESFTGPLRGLMYHLADLFILSFGGFMAFQGWILVTTNLNRAIPMIGMSESWRAAPLVICGVLIMIFSAADIAQRLMSRKVKRV